MAVTLWQQFEYYYYYTISIMCKRLISVKYINLYHFYNV